MQFLRMAARKIARSTLSVRFRRSDTIPIILGPLAGKAIPKAVALQNLGMVFGRYESHVVRELISPRKSIKIAYDIGAHIGYMTLALAMQPGPEPKVFAFEPDPENIALMQQLIKQNGLQDAVRVEPVALAEGNGQDRLIKGRCSSMFLLERALDGQDTKECSAITVDTCSLDAFVFEQSNPPPDVLKIDVEGAEALVIKGSLRTLEVYSPWLLMELHGPKNALKVWKLLQSLAYSWRHLTKNGDELVVSEKRLLSYFSKDSWTQHFLLFKEGRHSGV